MTAVSYPDIAALSHHGNYRAEARSQDNKTINQRDGRPADTTTFGFVYGQEQRGFRYQLIDERDSSVVWERWQEGNEPSPRELCVSDEGWVVIRTHGYDYARLIAVSPAGCDVTTIAIGCREPSPPIDATSFIQDDHIADSTAGLLWTSGATHCFFRQDARAYFCYVTGWGRRIILDLEGGRLVSESHMDAGIERACIESERQQAIPNLAQVAVEFDDYDGNDLFGGPGNKEPYWQRWPHVEGDIAVVIRNAFVDALPSLKAMEPRSQQQGYGGCHALPNDHSVFRFGVRPLLSLAIRHLGGIPAGYACYGFFRYEFDGRRDRDGKKILLRVPECVRNRDHLTTTVSRDMDAPRVLELLGAPDYLASFSERRDQIYVWGEHWDYYTGNAADFTALRVTWKAGSNGAELADLTVKPMPPDAVHQRIYEIIGF